MGIFIHDPKLETLEQEEKWIEAKDYLLELWNSDKNNVNNILRLGTECWYILAFWERLNIFNQEKIKYWKPLTEVKQYGEKFLCNNPTFLWIYGYMIKLFPYWFADIKDAINVGEKIGKDMIIKAHILEPQNPISEMLSINNENSKAYKIACKKSKELLDTMFDGQTEIEDYFKRVLDRVFP